MESTQSPHTVGYILQRFPALSEPAISEELLHLEAQGVLLHVFSLSRPSDTGLDQGIAGLRAEITHLPSFTTCSSVREHTLSTSSRYPHGYGRALVWALERGIPSLLRRFVQACQIADIAGLRGVSHFHAQCAAAPATVAYLSGMILDCPYSFKAHGQDLRMGRFGTKSLGEKIAHARFVVASAGEDESCLAQAANGAREKIVRIDKFDIRQTTASLKALFEESAA